MGWFWRVSLTGLLLAAAGVALTMFSGFASCDASKPAPPAQMHHHSNGLQLVVSDTIYRVITTPGGFVVELVFAIPGLGRYFVGAVQQLDYTVIMGTTVFYGAFLVFMVIVVDLVYGFIDPRVTLE